MNQYLKEFLHRGLMFGGFGPVIAGIIFAILDGTLAGFSLRGGQVLLAVISIYLLAFIHAGASVFNQIEHWPIAKSLFCHFFLLYVAYVCCYLLNAWIPFEPMVIAIFTAIFVVGYFVIWISVYLAIKATGKKLNKKLS